MFKLGPVHRNLRRYKNKKRKSVDSPPPPPPSWEEDGPIICVQIRRMTDRTASFLRFKIPLHTITHLINLSNSDCCGGIIRYVRHHHDHDHDRTRFFEYDLDPQINGPFPSDLSSFCSTAVIGSVVYGLHGGSCRIPDPNYDPDPDSDPNCHCIRYCDFAQLLPHWNITPLLPFHRYFPVMVTVNKQLYLFENCGVFGDEDDTSSSCPLGLLFDPAEERSKEVPFCAFHSVGVDNLVVASLGQKLLVLDERCKVQYYYDTENSTWIPLEIDGLLDHISNIQTQPISVPERNIIYWIDGVGNIRAFNWVNLKMFVGPIVGFGHECNLREVNRYCIKLVHLKNELFCLLWSDDSHLHLTVIRVSLDNSFDAPSDSPHQLTAFVVACSCYHFDSPRFIIEAAHLLS